MSFSWVASESDVLGVVTGELLDLVRVSHHKVTVIVLIIVLNRVADNWRG